MRSILLLSLLLTLSSPTATLADEEAPAAGPEAPPPEVAEPAATADEEAFDEEAFDDFAEFEEEFAGATNPVWDPLIGYNRAAFTFNDRTYLWIWKPLATGWSWIIPEPARVSLNKAFHNYRTPSRFGNALFQGKLVRAGTELGRLFVNTTIGLAGFFDPAEAWFGMAPPPNEDFGQTLGVWGLGDGFAFTIPLLGPSSLRDGLGMVPDIAMSPITYFVSTPISLGITTFEIFNRSSLHLVEYEAIKKDALVPYTFFREGYKQYRDKEIER